MKTLKLSNTEQVTTIDNIDYELVSQYNWRLKNSAYCSYVCASVRVGNTVQTIRLHRLIMNPTKQQDVHHIDKNPLNNVRSNLECLDRKYHRRLK